jgi:predicted NAD/FAD-dependent oxidoreductase
MADVVPFPSRGGLPASLTAEELVVLIRDLLGQGGRMVAREHAYDRMEERDINMRQVRHVLLRGEVIRGPEWSKHQNWAFTMQADTAGQLVTVGGAIDVDLLGQAVIVITVY